MMDARSENPEKVKWPLLQSKLSLEDHFDTRRVINYRHLVTSEKNVTVKCWKDKKTLLGIKVLVWSTDTNLLPAISIPCLLNTHTHNDSKSLDFSAKMIEPITFPAPQLSVHSHTHTERHLNAEPASARSDKGIFLWVMSNFSLTVWGT